MAADMTEDERLARQLQAQENRQTQMGAGQPMPVVQGTAVPGVQMGTPVGGQPVGAPGYGAHPYVDPGHMPVVLGMGQTGAMPMPYNVAVVPDIPPEEAVVLNYRLSLLCFTTIDAISTTLNLVSFIRSAFDDDKNDSIDEKRKSLFGHKGIVADETTRKVLGLAASIFLLGPLCGFIGARKLNRGLVMIYLMFCFAKTAYEIALAVLTPWLWYILIAFIQIWITKIVYTFWTALGRISKEKIEMMRRPDYIHSVPARIVYW